MYEAHLGTGASFAGHTRAIWHQKYWCQTRSVISALPAKEGVRVRVNDADEKTFRLRIPTHALTPYPPGGKDLGLPAIPAPPAQVHPHTRSAQ